MKEFLKKHAFPVIYGLLLAAFTVYITLDTFVITRVYRTGTAVSETEITEDSDAAAGGVTEEQEEETENETPAEIVCDENSYSDGTVSISISTCREYDTDIYVADIRISDPSLLKTALAQNAYGKNVTEKTSEMAEENGAILAINGDYYGAQEKGYVLRNGVLYRSRAESGQEDLVIWEDGSFEIICEDDVTAEELLEKGAVQILSFGPGLVEDGSISVSETEEVGKAKASNPRTAIAVTEDGHYLFIVSDGRTSESAGLSLYELASFAESLGAVTCYNLDGGGSSTMYFNGSIVNNPTSSGNSISERSVSDIVYIGY